jgi:hypothetical protein
MKYVMGVIGLLIGVFVALDAAFNWGIVRKIWIGFQPGNPPGGTGERAGQGVVGALFSVLAILTFAGVF